MTPNQNGIAQDNHGDINLKLYVKWTLTLTQEE